MIFEVDNLVRFKMHGKISLGIVRIVTDKLIHLQRLDDDGWFMFYDETYDEIIENFGSLTIAEFKEKYPENLI